MPAREVNNCEIIGEIGAGGMAVIYKAVQNSLNRPVAIKELKPEFGQDSQMVARFMREATALAALQHENIVHIYDFVKQDENFLMIMEFVEGIDLFDLLEEVPRLPVNVAATVALDLCSALEYAHYRGIIHRDIKPSNVILSRKGEVKLMDFGIARDENLGDLTRPGTSLGTPAYMSPEQIMGVKIDFRSDLFSFGILLYQMLTGTKPFSEGAGKSIMHKILNADFIRPRRLNPNIPRTLEKIIFRCLAKEPADRWPSTGELKRQLEKFLARRVKLHRSGRVLVFLHHHGMIPREEAETFVAKDFLDALGLKREDAGLPPPLRISTLAKVQVSLGMALLLWALVVFLFVGLTKQDPAMIAGGPPGALKVVAWPWAEIHIDGAYVDTTPVDRFFSLSPGVHEVRLVNPYFRTEVRRVLVETARTDKLIVTMKRKAH